MKPINKLDINFDVSGLSRWLSKCDLWGEYTMRSDAKGSPHKQMTDIWVRYKDPEPCLSSGDWSSFFLEHDSDWLKDVPFVKGICKKLMKFTKGSRLGGVLITKIKPGGEIIPHIDSGWHAKYYDKYYVAIDNKKGSVFCYDDVVIEPVNGEVHAFRNDKKHWVKNDSLFDRVAMIICIKQNKFSKEGLCLGEQQ